MARVLTDQERLFVAKALQLRSEYLARMAISVRLRRRYAGHPLSPEKAAAKVAELQAERAVVADLPRLFRFLNDARIWPEIKPD